MASKDNKSQAQRKSAPRLPWRRILVPIDFSKTSLRAFEVAVPLARDHGARLYVLSVIEPAGYVAGMEGLVIAVPDATLVENAKVNLPKVAQRFVPSAIPVTCLVSRGKPFDVITRTAKDNDVDLIVLTTQGHTGFDRFLMGSTAEQVVRHAHCPVYVVRTIRQGRGTQQRKRD